MLKTLDLLKPLTDDWGSDPTLQNMQSHPGNENISGRLVDLLAASKELEQAWERSLHCGLQLWTRFEMLLDWTLHLQQDGGTLGKESSGKNTHLGQSDRSEAATLAYESGSLHKLSR